MSISTMLRRKRAVVSVACLTVALAPVLTACGGGSTGPSAGSAVLRIGVANDFVGFDPYKDTGGDQPLVTTPDADENTKVGVAVNG